MITPKCLNPKWRDSTYKRIVSIIESCNTIEQYKCAGRMAIRFVDELWKYRVFTKTAGWGYSDAIHAVLISKLMRLNKPITT